MGLVVGLAVVGLTDGDFVGAAVGAIDVDGTRLGAVLGDVVGSLQANEFLSNNTQVSRSASQVSPTANFMVFHPTLFVVADASNEFVNPSASMSG